MKKLPLFFFLALFLHLAALNADDNISALKVTAVIPGRAIVRPGGSIVVVLHVENPTKEPIQFLTESCGWSGNWRTKGNIAFFGWDCAKNIPQLIEIAPGGSFTDELQAQLDEKAPLGKTILQFGFSSMPAGQISWSDKLEILIDPKTPAPAKNTNLNQPATSNRTLGPGCRELPWRR